MGRRPHWLWFDRVQFGFIEFRYQEIETMIRHIFRQPSHESYMVYKPIQEFSDSTKEYRLLSDLCTADWWWGMQVCESLYYSLLCANWYRFVEIDPKRSLHYPPYLWLRRNLPD